MMPKAKLLRSSTLSIVCLAFSTTAALHAATVSAPYTEDFSTLNSTTVASVYTETNDPNWSIVDESYQFTTSLKNNSGSAMVSASDFGATYADFVVSTTFTVTSASSDGTTNWGMALLGDSEAASKFILVDFGSNDLFRVVNVGGANGTYNDVNDSASFTFSKNTSYTLTATGTYSGSNLTMKVDITNNLTEVSKSITAAAFDVSADYTGSAMGLRARSGSGGGTTVQYDSFSIVPEPGTYALLAGFCMLGFVMLRRR